MEAEEEKEKDIHGTFFSFLNRLTGSNPRWRTVYVLAKGSIYVILCREWKLYTPSWRFCGPETNGSSFNSPSGFRFSSAHYRAPLAVSNPTESAKTRRWMLSDLDRAFREWVEVNEGTTTTVGYVIVRPILTGNRGLIGLIIILIL